jgi:hypothetical protein
LRIEIVPQCQQRGRFARLPRRVKHKVFTLVNQRKYFRQVDAFQRVERVLYVGFVRSRRVEIFFHYGAFLISAKIISFPLKSKFLHKKAPLKT